MKNTKTLTIVLTLLSGVVIGGFLGQYFAYVPYLSWLNFGQTFGIGNPLWINLGIIELSFSISITINIAGILGILIAHFIYKKIR